MLYVARTGPLWVETTDSRWPYKGNVEHSVVILNKLLNNQSNDRWFELPRRLYDVTVTYLPTNYTIGV